MAIGIADVLGKLSTGGYKNHSYPPIVPSTTTGQVSYPSKVSGKLGDIQPATTTAVAGLTGTLKEDWVDSTYVIGPLAIIYSFEKRGIDIPFQKLRITYFFLYDSDSKMEEKIIRLTCMYLWYKFGVLYDSDILKQTTYSTRVLAQPDIDRIEEGRKFMLWLSKRVAFISGVKSANSIYESATGALHTRGRIQDNGYIRHDSFKEVSELIIINSASRAVANANTGESEINRQLMAVMRQLTDKYSASVVAVMDTIPMSGFKKKNVAVHPSEFGPYLGCDICVGLYDPNKNKMSEYNGFSLSDYTAATGACRIMGLEIVENSKGYDGLSKAMFYIVENGVFCEIPASGERGVESVKNSVESVYIRHTVIDNYESRTGAEPNTSVARVSDIKSSDDSNTGSGSQSSGGDNSSGGDDDEDYRSL